MQKNNRVTIEDLALVTARGFDEIRTEMATMTLATEEQLANLSTGVAQQFSDVRGELKEIRSEMATKEDLENLAVITAREFKEIRSEMVTKEDLKNLTVVTAREFKEIRSEMVTKEEISELATKKDLNLFLHTIRQNYETRISKNEKAVLKLQTSL